MRVLIVTSRFGHGHRSVAEAIRRALAVQLPPPTVVEVADLGPVMSPAIDRVLVGAYAWVVRRAPLLYRCFYVLTDQVWCLDLIDRLDRAVNRRSRARLDAFLDGRRPDLVVLTYGGWTPAVTASVRARLGPVPVVAVVTDAGHVHRPWVHGDVDHVVVSDERAAASAIALGVASSRVHTLGHPVATWSGPGDGTGDGPSSGPGDGPGDPRRHRGRPGGPPRTVLYLVSIERSRAALAICRRLRAGLPGWRCLVVTGTNRSAYRVLKTADLPGTTVLSWTDDMTTLLRESDVVITKPGGSIVAEALAADTPMVFHRQIPGQEAGNVNRVTAAGWGLVVRHDDEIVGAVRSLGTRGSGRHGVGTGANLTGATTPVPTDVDAAGRVAGFLAARVIAGSG